MRVLIVDDEPLARGSMRRLLEAIPNVMVMGESADGYAAVEDIQDMKPDVVCLDVQMPGLDGFGVIESLAELPLPPIIFVTAHDEYALRAFRVHAVDYLLKPVRPAELVEAIRRADERVDVAYKKEGDGPAIRRLLDDVTARPAGPMRYLQRILVRQGERVLFIRTSDVRFIESADNYMRVHSDTGAFLIRSTMRQLETRLDPDQFARVHRRTIIALDRIREVTSPTPGEYDIHLTDGSAHRLGRSYRDAFFARAG